MSKDINAQIDILEKKLLEDKAKLSSSLTITAVIYALIVLFVFIYTNILVSWIKKDATPESIAAIAVDSIKAKIPQLEEQLIKSSEDQAPVMVKKVMEMAHSAIPKAEDFAKTQINIVVDDVLNHTKEKYMPELKKYFKDVFDRAIKDKDVLKDKDVAKHLAQLLAAELDRELAAVINGRVVNRMEFVKDEALKILSKPNDQLTNRERSEKNVLVYVKFLVDNAQTGKDERKSYVAEFLQFGTSAMDEFKTSLPKMMEEKK